ncbi:Six-hairpin glycosidase [Trametes versicolor FP-101664 SS1]|uniref:Six-hairpin glycosidase n=1 Tax=Trametes versicolor (strain FP-101664) TaxID=717944 RepID=UPI000462243A|nr:Six-hairpin glycosidase [Trametes versicolor FP-101664 SS1]EIW56808.1 Six-hairpin glycosidase [Trametes versicolor FP-101664 SS1]
MQIHMHDAICIIIHNSEGNALLFQVLVTAADLASHVNATSLSSAWSANATALKQRFNEVFWLPSARLYRDNDTTTLCPQDANSMAVLFNLTATPEQVASVSEGLSKNWSDLGPVAPELPDTISPFISGLELQAHFASGNDARAMDLLRREWGYMLYTNLSVQSTLLEGFTANGSLSYRSYRGYNYDPSYTSHAHGWSSGPTSALTYYVLGLTVTSPQGRTWSVAPHTSGLSAVEGGFTTPLGWFGVKWALKDRSFALNIDVPEGTTGAVKLAFAGKVLVNGKAAQADEGDTL